MFTHCAPVLLQGIEYRQTLNFMAQLPDAGRRGEGGGGDGHQCDQTRRLFTAKGAPNRPKSGHTATPPRSLSMSLLWPAFMSGDVLCYDYYKKAWMYAGVK